MPYSNGVHSQFFARTDFPHGAVAHDKNFIRLQSRPLLDFAESCFFGEYVATVGKINFFDGGLAIQAQGFHFCVLGLRLAKADDEIPDAALGKKAQ